MGSLANCIKIHGISKTEAASLRKKAMEYRKDGMKAKLANEQAVSDMLTDLTAEKDSIAKQIQAVLARRQPEKAGLRQKVQGLIDTGQITKEELDTHVRDKTILQRLGVATEGEGKGRVEDRAPVGKKAVHGQVEGKAKETDLTTLIQQAKASEEYRGAHQIKHPITTADKLEYGDSGFEWQYVKETFNLTEQTYKESYNILKKIKDNPDAEVTIYRAVPKGINTINDGDWVTLSMEYAKNATGDVNTPKIISKKVKAKEVAWDGNDLNEFAYKPDLQKAPAPEAVKPIPTEVLKDYPELQKPRMEGKPAEAIEKGELYPLAILHWKDAERLLSKFKKAGIEAKDDVVNGMHNIKIKTPEDTIRAKKIVLEAKGIKNIMVEQWLVDKLTPVKPIPEGKYFFTKKDLDIYFPESSLRKGKIDITEGKPKSTTELVKDLNDALGEKGAIGEGEGQADISKVAPILIDIGKTVYADGHTSYVQFKNQMKETLGEAYHKVRDYILKVWEMVKRFNRQMGEVGAVGDIKKRIRETTGQVKPSEPVKEVDAL